MHPVLLFTLGGGGLGGGFFLTDGCEGPRAAAGRIIVGFGHRLLSIEELFLLFVLFVTSSFVVFGPAVVLLLPVPALRLETSFVEWLLFNRNMILVAFVGLSLFVLLELFVFFSPLVTVCACRVAGAFEAGGGLEDIVVQEDGGGGGATRTGRRRHGSVIPGSASRE